MTFLPEDMRKYDYALICIDVFSKLAHVVPMKALNQVETSKAIQICFNEMGGSPSYVMSDQGGEFMGKFKDVLKENGTSQEFTRTHATFAERFIKTLKNYMVKKTEASNKPWHDLLDGFLKAYNSEEREATKMTPIEASKDKNSGEVRFNLLMQAKQERKYPAIGSGDEVKIYNKGRGKYGARKMTFSKWYPERLKVEKIEHVNGMKQYRLEGKNGTYLRHELLKV
jgi:hypothetical protein